MERERKILQQENEELKQDAEKLEKAIKDEMIKLERMVN